MKKYGKENFKLEIIDSAISMKELNEKEIFWISTLNTLSPNGYNLTTGGSSGGKASEETRIKIGLSCKGRRHTEEWKRAQSLRNSGKNNPMYGKSPNWGKKCSAETIEKLRKSNLDKKLSEEQKKKIGMSRTKDKIDRVKLSMAHGGKPFMCIETGEIFYSQAIAAEKLKSHQQNIYKVLKGIRERANGLSFKYV